jgi:hypothetical protein
MLEATVILLSLTFKSCRRKIVFEICRNKRYEKAIGRTPESSPGPGCASRGLGNLHCDLLAYGRAWLSRIASSKGTNAVSREGSHALH